MERDQFTFYASFARAILRIRRMGERCAAYDAIVKYALYEELPQALPDGAAIVFDLVRPVLDTGREKARGGKKGKKQPQDEPDTNGEDDGKTEERSEKDTGKTEERGGEDNGKEKEGEVEKEVEKEVEYECTTTPTPPAQSALGFFLDRVNASPSAGAVAELQSYVARLGDELVRYAMGAALDEGKTAWSYIRAILRRYEREGLRSVEAVQRAELERIRRQGAKRRIVSAAEVAARPAEPVDLEKLKRLMEEL